MFDEAIAKFLRQGAEMLRTEETNNAPVVTGRLRGDITVFPQVKSTEISVGNTSLIDYAVYVYYGTKPHTIRPKKKKSNFWIVLKGSFHYTFIKKERYAA